MLFKITSHSLYFFFCWFNYLKHNNCAVLHLWVWCASTPFVSSLTHGTMVCFLSACSFLGYACWFVSLFPVGVPPITCGSGRFPKGTLCWCFMGASAVSKFLDQSLCEILVPRDFRHCTYVWHQCLTDFPGAFTQSTGQILCCSGLIGGVSGCL